MILPFVYLLKIVTTAEKKIMDLSSLVQSNSKMIIDFNISKSSDPV